MKLTKQWKPGIAILILLVIAFAQYGCSLKDRTKKIPVRVLLLPKFEMGDMSKDFPGEAQLFYEEYLAGGEEYEIPGESNPDKLYYKDGVALFTLGEGKVSAALGTSAVLSDERFDFSDAYIISVGCGGVAEGYGIFGDLFVISEVVDFDLGYRADSRDLGNKEGPTWFHYDSLDDNAFVRLDQKLTDRVYNMVKNVQLDTTEKTEAFLSKEYPGEAWAQRPPRVMRGTGVTSDSYWKGINEHKTALRITETYKCRDPFAVTEMEDVAVAQAVRDFGLLDHFIILRVGVNMDVFPAGVTPEMLWGEKSDDSIASEESIESVDIFETAMKNCFDVGKVVIDAIQEDKL